MTDTAMAAPGAAGAGADRPRVVTTRISGAGLALAGTRSTAGADIASFGFIVRGALPAGS